MTCLQPGLYLVATPIGNLGDISQRAAETLAAVDRILCEDTRITGRLLHKLGVHKPLVVYNEHSSARIRPRLLAALQDGQKLALEHFRKMDKILSKVK